MIIYKTTNKINGKIYIGMDTKNNDKYLGSGLLLQKAIKKHGLENFKKEIIEHCNSKKQLSEREKYWIKQLNSQNPKVGYNIADGGHGGNTYTEECKSKVSKMLKNRIVSEETRKKMSNSRKGKNYLTEESKKRISQAHKGKKLSEAHKEKLKELGKKSKKSKEFLENIGNIQAYRPIGSKHTEESKKKISEYHRNNPVKYWLGKKRPLEMIEKAKESNKGFKHTEEFKKKRKGDGNPFYGKTHTEEIKKKLSDIKLNRTPEQKLESYKKFYFSKTGKQPSEKQLEIKLNLYRNV